MKRNNYNDLKATYEAYERACKMSRDHPGDLDYKDAVNWTYSNLIERIRFILWDEAPAGIKTPTNPDDLPF